MQASRFCARQRVVLRQFSSHAPAPSPLPTPAPKASAFYPPASPSSPKPSIIRPLAFSVGVALAGLATAAYLTNSDAQRVSKEIVERTGLWRRNQRTVSDGEMATFRQRELLGTAQAVVAEFPRSARLPTIVAEKYINLSEGQRTCIEILAINTCVFIAWQIPPLRAGCTRFLLHNPLSTRSFSLLGSVFSHKSLPHFAFNSIALYSFAASTSSWLNSRGSGLELPRSTSRYEFLALFVAAGLCSSIVSHLWSVRVLLPRMLRSAGTAVASPAILPSLGASGAIYSCLVITGLAWPDASVSLIFLPLVPIPISSALYGMVALDLLGLFRGWRMFDHAAHLGGAAFGLFYFKYGHEAFERFRRWLGRRGPSRIAQT